MGENNEMRLAQAASLRRAATRRHPEYRSYLIENSAPNIWPGGAGRGAAGANEGGDAAGVGGNCAVEGGECQFGARFWA